MLKLLVIGHLGKDATVNQVNGKNVVNFTVAHSEKYKDAQGVQVEKTNWVDCAYWTDRAVAPYLKKGTQVYAEGIPDVRSYTTNDGRVGATLTLRVLSLQFIGAKTEGSIDPAPQQSAPAAASPSYQQVPAYVPPASSITEPADDLPF